MTDKFNVIKSSIFPSLVYEIDSHDLIDETIEIFEQSTFPEHAPYATERVYILEKNQSLIKKFEDRLNYAVKDVQYSVPFKMTTSWFTCTPPGYPIHLHNHVNCYWSASFYFFNECSPLHLVKDKNAIYVPFATTDPNLMMSGTISIPANRGIMIAFPSHIHHYISRNTANHNRYSLAMNFIPDGLCSFFDSEYNYK